MLRHTLLVACTVAFCQAWVPFPGAEPLHHDPWDHPTPKNLEIQTSSSAESSEQTAISTIPSMTTIPVPVATGDSIPYHEQILRWIKRQGAIVANPAAAQPTEITQVSPITTLTMMSAGISIAIPYTQTFAAIPEQWPSPSSGTIGLGTIQGEVGQVKTKTKRQEPQHALVSVQTAVAEIVHPLQDLDDMDKDSDIEQPQLLPTRRRSKPRGP